MTRFANASRHHLWRAVCAVAGGLTVTGDAPPGPGGMVVVANHASHADTAALLAGLPASRGPVFAAAADYWFDVWWRRLLITGLAGGLPVRRGDGGGYAGLYAAAAPALAAGRAVVIYPEGTRTTDGTVGRFHSGALRLARDCGVPILPVAVLGTGDVLAKHGRFAPTPMETRVGTALPPGEVDAADLRDQVVEMLGAGRATVRRSPIWRRIRDGVDQPTCLALGFTWGFAEAVSWPIMAEMALVFFGVASPQRIPALAASVTAGSVCGVLTTAALARRGVRAPAPLTTPRMHAAARRHLTAGVAGIGHQALGGIPVKVYARAAGELDLPAGKLAVAALIERGARMAGCAAGVMALERPLRPLIRRLYGPYLAVSGVVFTITLRQIVRAWGPRGMH